MLKNMANSLLMEKRIFTTLAKAKALRKFVEPIITRAKQPTQHNQRVVFSVLREKEVVKELFERIGPKVADRPGGYVRILKTGKRLGDNAEMCMIELVDYNEAMLEDSKAKTRRSRRGGKKSSNEGDTSATVVEEPTAEADTTADETKDKE